MDEKNISRIKKYLTEISSICEINDAYIFGSSVHRTDIEKSDIDLAIISEIFNEHNYIDYLSRFLIISAKNRLNIEPHLYNSEDLNESFVKQEIISKGIKIAH
ncbi:MAG: hypothetical protein GY950_33335 [bacterium]|nr:hypothetical protein [bacterium]